MRSKGAHFRGAMIRSPGCRFGAAEMGRRFQDHRGWAGRGSPGQGRNRAPEEHRQDQKSGQTAAPVSGAEVRGAHHAALFQKPLGRGHRFPMRRDVRA